MSSKPFDITEDHIKLLKRAYIGWNDCEFGAPSIDCKRPYGNSDVYGDMAKILGIKPTGDEYEPFTNEQLSYMNKTHNELQAALPIFVRLGKMEPGRYGEINHGEWEKIK
jgi:hypothetical protein